jgi:uncharacterized protein (DUF2267 family)
LTEIKAAVRQASMLRRKEEDVMSTGLPVFDTTVQETNEWLRAVETRLPPCSRVEAYGATRAVLQGLRDRLPLALVLGLSAQLPMLMRGFVLEGWRPEEAGGSRDLKTFLDDVEGRLPPGFPRETIAAAQAVLAVAAKRLDPGEVDKIIRHSPGALRTLWPVEAGGR